MKQIIVGLMATALLTFGQGTIKQRANNQHNRIRQGVQNGSLTKPEAARLRAQQREIRQDVRQDRRDGGGLTKLERKQATREQNQASRRIARQKHDGQTRN
jgi:hypothetical protein